MRSNHSVSIYNGVEFARASLVGPPGVASVADAFFASPVLLFRAWESSSFRRNQSINYESFASEPEQWRVLWPGSRIARIESQTGESCQDRNKRCARLLTIPENKLSKKTRIKYSNGALKFDFGKWLITHWDRMIWLFRVVVFFLITPADSFKHFWILKKS